MTRVKKKEQTNYKITDSRYKNSSFIGKSTTSTIG